MSCYCFEQSQHQVFVFLRKKKRKESNPLCQRLVFLRRDSTRLIYLFLSKEDICSPQPVHVLPVSVRTHTHTYTHSCREDCSHLMSSTWTSVCVCAEFHANHRGLPLQAPRSHQLPPAAVRHPLPQGNAVIRPRLGIPKVQSEQH